MKALEMTPARARAPRPASPAAASAGGPARWLDHARELQRTLGNRATQEVMSARGGDHDVRSAPIEAVLAGPPAPRERDHEQKAADLADARITAERLVGRAKSVAEVEAYFPLLTERFGLAEIGWEDLGTPAAALRLRVNPAAKILVGRGGLELNLGDLSKNSGLGLAQKVTFETDTYGGDEVGVEMEAERLGPNHPQGGPPQGGALGTIMKLLPTKPTLPGTRKYIKGHLLNDNLGGPGVAQNLFPITAQANKEHEQAVEHYVKKYVNEDGFWVYYHVEVTGIDDHTGDGSPYIDADLKCTVQKLDATGKRTGSGAFVKIIRSRFGSVRAPTVGAPPSAEAGAGAAARVPRFDEDAVEWSTARGDATQPQERDSELVEVVNRLMENELFELANEAARSAAVANLIDNANPQQREILLGQTFDDFDPSADAVARLRNWNMYVNQMNDRQASQKKAGTKTRNKAKIVEVLEKFDHKLEVKLLELELEAEDAGMDLDLDSRDARKAVLAVAQEMNRKDKDVISLE